jgi:glycosyltransferase involved in cell wall biosynthesis
MNLLFSCGDYHPNAGGAMTLVDDLAVTLLADGHEVTVLTRRHPGLTPSERYHGYDIERLDYPLPYEKLQWKRFGRVRSAAVLWQVARLIRARKIETVCIGLLDMSAWYLLWLRRVMDFRLVLYLHGGETRALPAMEPTYAALLCAALKEADAVVAVSKELRDEAARMVPEALPRIEVIINAIDLRHIREAQSFPHRRPYIAAVGRLVYEKDFATLLRAYAAVQREIGEIDLVFAGAGKQESMLRGIAAECPRPERIVFLGKTARELAISVMKGSIFVALPSVTEGFPIVAVEALAVAKPIVGSRITGNHAVVEDGRQGNLFAPGDVAELCHWLRTYCLDPEHRRRMTDGAARVNLDTYDMGLVASKHLRAFRADH